MLTLPLKSYLLDFVSILIVLQVFLGASVPLKRKSLIAIFIIALRMLLTHLRIESFDGSGSESCINTEGVNRLYEYPNPVPAHPQPSL